MELPGLDGQGYDSLEHYRCWAKAVSDPEAKALWERYFPKGRPTPEQYILRLGQAQETGEEMPWLLKE